MCFTVKALSSINHFLIDLVLPTKCNLCNKHLNHIYLQEVDLARLLCFTCQKKLFQSFSGLQIGKESFDIELSFDVYWNLIEADAFWRKLLYNWKFENRRYIVYVFQHLMKQVLPEICKEKIDYIVCINSGDSIYENRRFQPCMDVCKYLSDCLHIPYGAKIHKVKKYKQSRHSQYERFLAVRESMKVLFTEVPDSCLLVDDIITTGATLNEAAATLKKAGVKKVIAFSLLRQKLNNQEEETNEKEINLEENGLKKDIHLVRK